MRTIYTLILLYFSLMLSAQLNINVSTAGYQNIIYESGNIFPDSANIIFKSDNKLPRYDNVLKSKGLTFRNGLTNNITKSILTTKSGGATSIMFSSPVITVDGNTTVLRIKDSLVADNNEAYGAILLWNGGKFIIDTFAKVDLINGAYFTRQLWVWSDGTGVFEIADGFIADLTQNGTSPTGMGSLRFSKCNIITNSTSGLPMGYRPNTTTGIADINSHFVFENQDSSVWIINTHPQNYRGGLWLDASMIVHTNTELNISGVKTVTNEPAGGEYTNWGGVMMKNLNGKSQTLTKRGSETLILSGDHGYDSGSSMIIEQGKIVFLTDPWTYSGKYDTIYKFTKPLDKANLRVALKQNATLEINTPLFRIDSLSIEPNSILKININDTILCRKINLNGGLLNVNIPTNHTIVQGVEYKVFTSNLISGSFNQVTFNNGNGVTWDLSKLYSDGIIKAATVNSLETITSTSFQISPNPASESIKLNVPSLFINKTADIITLTGKKMISVELKENENQVNISTLASGVYIIKIESESIKLIVK